jgi:hypothetical protein
MCKKLSFVLVGRHELAEVLHGVVAVEFQIHHASRASIPHLLPVT